MMNSKNEQNVHIKELDPDIIPPRTDQYKNPNINCASKIVIVGKPGCFEAGTQILMHDGKTKNVEDVQKGDSVMGDDSTVRSVIETCTNTEQMYKISLDACGDSYTVNENHKLVLISKQPDRIVTEMKVGYYVNMSPIKQKQWCVFKRPVMFKRRSVPINPYLYGLLAVHDDINSRDTGNEYNVFTSIRKYCHDNFLIYKDMINSYSREDIQFYRINHEDVRRSFLLGVIDANIRYSKNTSEYQIDIFSKELARDVKFISNSIGLHTRIEQTVVSYNNCKTNESELLDVNVLYIQDKDQCLPTQVSPYSDNQVNMDLIIPYDFSVTPMSKDVYYGFTLDGNHRFLLESCDVVRNTGKSTLIKSLLYAKKHIFPCAIALSGSEDSNHAYSEFMPHAYIYNEYSEDTLTEFIKRQKLAKQHLDNPWCALIIDDCTDDPTVFNKPVQHALYKKGRHWNMMYILSLQYAMDVRPVIRTNVDGVFILREPLKNNRDSLYKNYASVIPTYNMFCDLMDQLTDDYCALFILSATNTNQWQDCVFYYKASMVPEGWKLGCETYWDHSNQRYNEDYVDPVII